MDWLQITKDANKVMRLELGVYPRYSKLRVYAPKSWKKNMFFRGIYTVETLTAHVNTRHYNWISTIFHEYHGHGTYYEQSSHGRFAFHLKDCNIFREESEGFALWIDKYLCEKLNLTIWNRKKRPISDIHKNGLERIENIIAKQGVHGMIRTLGFLQN